MKTNQAFNIYLTGVGGQGIGLLSEALLRAVDASDQAVKGVDTHGLAQRGGVVSSHVRVGEQAHSPLVAAGQAHLAVALERHEAMRAIGQLGAGGTLIYYDVEWQPLPVRVGKAARIGAQAVAKACQDRGVTHHRVFVEDLEDARMQNTAVLAHIAAHHLVPGVQVSHYQEALETLLGGVVLERNLALLHRLVVEQAESEPTGEPDLPTQSQATEA